MKKQPDDDFIKDIKELLFVSKFMITKREIKKERKVIKNMIKDYEDNNFDKYVENDGDYDD